MKNFLKFDIRKIINYFPCTLILCVGFVILSWIGVHTEDVFENQWLLAGIMSVALSIPLMAAGERIDTNLRNKFQLGKIGALILSLLYFLYIKHFIGSIVEIDAAFLHFFPLMIGAVLLFFLVGGFAERNISQETYWHELISLGTRLIMSVIGGGILFAGISIGIVSMNQLFGLQIDDKIFFDVWIFLAGMVSVPFFLAGVPDNHERIHQNKDTNLHTARIFANFIFASLTLLYALLLYVYFIKILFTGDWPSGFVAQPILVFCVVGIIMTLFLYPFLHDAKNKKERLLTNIFAITAIPAICMLFAAIWKRIDVYGITEARYFGFAAGVWLLIAVGLWLFKQRDLRIYFGSFLIFLVLTTIGPTSASNISLYSQKGRLEKILIEKNIIQDEKIVRIDQNNLTAEEWYEIDSMVSYIIENHGIKTFETYGVEFPEDKNGLVAYEAAGIVFSAMGWDDARYTGFGDKFYHYNGYTYTNDVKNYDYAIEVSSISLPKLIQAEKTIYIQSAEEEKTLTVQVGDQTVSVDLENAAQDLVARDSAEEGYRPNEYSIIAKEETDTLRITFVITELFVNTKGDSIKTVSAEGILLIDEK